MAAAIADGEADLAIGTERISRQIEGLDFIPLLEERYDLVMRREAFRSPAGEAISEILRSAPFKKEISHFTGNNYRDMGKIIAEV
jgi:putative molybdopterin biosynthesis protein